jgi:CRISPR/Cas system CSM-associated protein Csm3 (group 7 of RAMP superfamily)
MQKAVIKECTNKSTYYQIALIIGKKPMWYDIEISSDDFKLLKSSKECEFETNGKALTKLFVGGKEIALNRIDQAKLSMPNKASKQNSENYSRKRNSNKNRIDNNISPNKQAFKEYAKAPYNFVPINETVIPAETIPEFDYYHKDRYTGYIDLDIEALTPLYIRDTYTKEEEVLANQAKEACKICKDKDCDKCDHAKHRVNPDFFAPGGIPKIPGSSLRGMVRNLVEIISYSKMEYVNYTRFDYREVKSRKRVPYVKTVKDHIPSANKNFMGTEFATAIFGNADKFAGRVFFEDAQMIEDAGQYPALSPRILSTPKPTAVQHYLVQKGKKMANWNDDPDIRGHKLYWHRRTSDDHRMKYSWPESGEINTQHTVIEPQKPGTKFKGRIRFDNLSDVELGALLFALDLPRECAHKIGMGKPLGLGSIRISPTVVISKRTGESASHTGRYGKLFDNQQWYLPVEKVDKDLKAEFSRYIWSALPDEEKAGADSVNDLWSIPRIKELWVMLRYDKERMGKSDWLEKTRYMEIEREGVPPRERNEFRNRPILQSPSEILN